MKLSATALAAVAAFVAQPSLACTDPPEDHDRRISDVVAEGRLRCDLEALRCSLSVSRYLKPSRSRQVSDRALIVRAENDIRQAWNDEGLIVLTCPGPFDPELDDFVGRFYLIFDEGEDLYRVRRYYVRDRDGEFYHLGIKCTPEFENDQGQLSRECGSVEDELRAQEQ